MKPSDAAATLAARIRRDTTLNVYDKPSYVQTGADIAVVVGDPEVLLADDGIAAFGSPFDRGVRMEWEIQMRYTRSDWDRAHDAFYDILESITSNLEVPNSGEPGTLNAIVESVERAEPIEDDDGNQTGVVKTITLYTFS